MERISFFLTKIKDKYLEMISYILLILWSISPLVEYILKYFIKNGVTQYFVITIYITGSIGLISYIIYLYKNKISLKKEFIPQFAILFMFFWAFIATILSKDSYLSLFGESYRKEGLIVYLMYIGFIASSMLIKKDKYRLNIFRLIIFSAFIISLLPLFWSNFSYDYFSNVFHNANHYGYYLMIALMLSAFMFAEGKGFIRIIYLLLFLFFLQVLIRNNTFGCYLAVLVSFLCYVIYSFLKKNNRGNALILFSVFIISSIMISQLDIKIGERVNLGDTSGLLFNNFISLKKDAEDIFSKDEKSFNEIGTGRGLLWKHALNYTLENPIFGGGMESLNTYYIDHEVYYNDRPHNIILQISAFAGIPTAIMYLFLIFYLALYNYKNMKINLVNKAIYFTAMAYFISSIFGNSMYYTSPYFMVLLGFLMSNISVNESVKNM